MPALAIFILTVKDQEKGEIMSDNKSSYSDSRATSGQVPISKDGSHFGKHLGERGYYQVGAKGEEVKYEYFDEAMEALRCMGTAKWRRPNDKGNWGIVSAKRWGVVD